MLPTYAQQYRRLWQEHWWWRARTTYVARWVTWLAGRRQLEDILDIGCGDGLMFPILERFGRVRGIEPDGKLLSSTCRHRALIENVAFDAAYRTPQRYDLVLMLDVLEHIEDDRNALGAVQLMLKPGGFVLLTVPAVPLLWSRHDIANQHYRRYLLSGLGRMLADQGWHVVTLEYFFFWTVAPLLLRRLLAPACTPADGTQSYVVRVPPRPVNGLAQAVCQVEQLLARRLRLPLGSSCLAIAAAPTSKGAASAR